VFGGFFEAGLGRKHTSEKTYILACISWLQVANKSRATYENCKIINEREQGFAQDILLWKTGPELRGLKLVDKRLSPENQSCTLEPQTIILLFV
jgi:hypothetical protein